MLLEVPGCPKEIALKNTLIFRTESDPKQVLDVVTSEKCNRSPVVIFVLTEEVGDGGKKIITGYWKTISP
jgi:hypothetical protein